jgi:hypothetical protein
MSGIFAFCRLAIGLAFLLAFVGKARNIQQFSRTITSFYLLPAQLSMAAAFLILGGELSIIVCMLLGSAFLLPGFLLALALLLSFSGALAIVLGKKQSISCNCFGTNNQPVSSADLWRNAGLVLCAAGGCYAQGGFPHAQPLNPIEWLLVALMATAFVLLWTQLGTLIQLFR